MKWKNLFRRRPKDADIQEEIQAHLNMAAQDRIGRGESPQQARAAALREFGNTSLVREDTRAVWISLAIERFGQDLKFGARQLAKAPALVAVAVISLALGIGANTAIFTLINAVMLQSLPVRDPARLVLFYDGLSTGVYNGDGVESDEFSYPFWEYLQTHHEPFESLAAFRQSNDRVILHVAGSNDSGPSERATVHMVAGNYFDVLGVGAAAGRLLTPADDSPTSPPVAVASYPFWRDRFDLDPSTIGREVVLNGTAFTIVGVADREFFGERIQSAPDFWLPLSAQPGILQKESWRSAADVFWLNFLGRRKPGVTLAQAQAAMNLHFQQFYLAPPGLSAEQRHKIETTHIELKPGGGGISGLRYLYSKPLHILMAVVAVVLLIACANIATLLLARALPRRQEFLIRLALGASRGRLLRQVLTESVLLSAVGGLAGAGFAWWSVKALVALLGVNPVVRVSPDPIVLGFTLALSILTGIFFGIFPALKFSRLEHRPADIPRSTRGKRFGAAQALIATQVSLSVILLFGAGLLGHSLLALEGQDLGFQRDNVLVIGTDASLAGYQKSELLPLYRDIADRLSTLPGVVSASICRFTPVSGYSSSGNFSLQGHTPARGERLDVHYLPVAPAFFETLGIPLMLGRTIGSQDTPAGPPAAVVNQTFVDQFLAGQNPLGQHIMLGAPFQAPGSEIVGVVADSKYFDLRERPQPMAFFSLWQTPVPDIQIVLRTAGTAAVGPDARKAIRQISPKLPIFGVRTLDAQIEESLRQQKLLTTLCSVFGLLAVMLAAVGIYGTLAYAVAGRTIEIGIRMALGAQRRHVVWMVLRDSFAVIALGVAVGLPLAFGTTRWLESFLFGVTGIDPLAIAAALLLIVAMALPAGYLPARRAARVDPMRAVRHE